MKVSQIYEIVNNMTNDVLGETDLTLAEDLSNIVDIGTALMDAASVDNYVRSLVDHIGRMVFVNRPYSGSVPSVLMDAWEFGSILEKVSCDLPAATENESWELEDGGVYEENIFYKPSVNVKFFDKRTTFEIPISITERQAKSAFSNLEQLNAFVSMLYTQIEKSMAIKLDALVMSTINNFIAETLYDEYEGENYADKSTVKAVNLLKEYNDEKGTELTADKALKDMEFLKYATYKMGLYESRLAKVSNLFNIGKKDRFTPSDLLHIVMLADFKKAADVYLQSSTFHNELTKLPNAEVVPFWQGSGQDYSFASTSKINVKTASGNNVEAGGILAVMFDRDALGVTNMNRRTTSKYNAKAEFVNNWFKMDAGYFNDANENFVVFFVA